MQHYNQTNNSSIPQPPEMISSKDLLYLTDMMSWNLSVIKKANFLAKDCKLTETKQALDQLCQMHERHYQALLNFTKSHNNQMVH
ncbi:hypothetical protein [Amphibacillus jilinensis]|uniref:hypothetical protein n=1 Tax=Amphibacillus jilinensis TaxID=1216008 RepID=UPI00030F169B|nr:hypothetical protein [Amphibacillus jilinensis]